ncbi:MAG: hypothetical protein ACFCAD_09385 [Pleurocapsa sp.]
MSPAPNSYDETNTHSQILDRGGYVAEINSCGIHFSIANCTKTQSEITKSKSEKRLAFGCFVVSSKISN